jgi:hypothetical protein
MSTNRQQVVCNEMDQAKTIRRADLRNNRPTDLARFGFVLITLEKVDAAIRREDAVRSANAEINTRPGRIF